VKKQQNNNKTLQFFIVCVQVEMAVVTADDWWCNHTLAHSLDSYIYFNIYYIYCATRRVLDLWTTLNHVFLCKISQIPTVVVF
jgi:hypothetical protein